MPEIEIRELSEAERACLGCTLFAPVCDGKDKGCRYVEIRSLGSGKQPLAFHTPEAKAKAAEGRQLSLTLSPAERKTRRLDIRRDDDRAYYEINKDRINARKRERRRERRTMTAESI